ncbi:23S rRNA (pseudouridine(1915)-N(3))-methyltransferase RlmH [Patescibacteria group bacterium]|nr:23S rRNA (pseudouridine(1915)-N(3))-methyltransferase RlmH [Patescibacteria group bacterium]
MIKLTLITVGDLPKGLFSELGDDFRKRLRPFVKLEHKIVDNESKIENQIPTGDMIVILDERGKLMTSPQVAELIGLVEDRGQHVTVIIGGPKGLSDKTKSRANFLFALSPLTFTHDFAHILFLEQLYRAFTILRGKEYHY